MSKTDPTYDLRPEDGRTNENRTDSSKRVNKIELTMTDADRLIDELISRKESLTKKQLEKIEEELLFSL